LRRIGPAAQANPLLWLGRAYATVTADHMIGHYLNCGYGKDVLEKPDSSSKRAAQAKLVAVAAAAAAAAVAAAFAAVAAHKKRI